MPDTSATPELQATADLSPLSPSPLHSAPAVALPALQDTADILDAMMEMPANNETHLGPGAGVAGRTYTHINPGQGIAMAARPTATLGKGEGGGQDARDSDNDFDSLGDPYAEDQETSNNLQPQPEEPNTAEDDYLKSFDSPIQNEQDESAAANDVSQDSRPHRPPPEQVEHAALAQSSDRAYHHGQPQSSLHASTIPGKSDDHADDISRLVAEMTGQAAEEGPHDQYNTGPPAQSQQPRPSAQAAVPPVSSVPSLPARPPMPQPAHSASKFASASMFPHESHAHQQPFPVPPAYAAPVVPALPNVQPLSSAPLTPGQPSTYVAAGARGSLSEGASLPHTPVVPIQSMTAPPYPDPSGFAVRQPANDAANRETLWERFNADERRYMSEAKWDRFPEGSRIFIGNLSSERVSKRDVFDIFHQYGQLAQISLKSAYGFVQYHTVEDAQAVMQNLQGIEIKGRKIHLEICRTQKKKGNDRGRSRSPNRGSRGSRDGAQRRDRFDDGPGRRQRDEQPQHARGASPRRGGDGEMYGRDRGYYEAHPQPRERSRSPPPHGRPQDPYRRRSPSPAHPHPFEDRLEIPRRYGPQVPDVQFLLLEEVGHEFVDWVQRAFLDRGLKVDVMFLNRGFPRAAVLQRQVMEGVHGIVDLDMRAHAYGKISLQVFDRSTGGNARFDQYQDLDPPIAAELVLRAKSQAVPTQPYNGNSTSNGSHHYPPQPAYPAGDYGQRHHQPYAPPPPPHAQVSPHSPSFPVGHGPQGRPMYPPHQGPPDLPGVPGQLDGPGLQRFLASVQNQQSSQGAGGQLGHPGEQIDIQALLAGLKGGPVGGTQPGPYGGQGYPTAGPPHNNGRPGPHHYDMNMGSPDSTSQVNTIMAQLARFRQP